MLGTWFVVYLRTIQKCSFLSELCHFIFLVLPGTGIENIITTNWNVYCQIGYGNHSRHVKYLLQLIASNFCLTKNEQLCKFTLNSVTLRPALTTLALHFLSPQYYQITQQ